MSPAVPYSLLIIPILCLGLIAAAGIAAYFLIQKRKEVDPSAEDSLPPRSAPPSSPKAENSSSPEEIAPVGPPETCPSCGHRNPEDNNFCEQCGASLEKA